MGEKLDLLLLLCYNTYILASCQEEVLQIIFSYRHYRLGNLAKFLAR